MILLLCNQKGGVGKSTTTYHLTRSAIREGQRVLVIDLDPQGNITRGLTRDVASDAPVVADALSERSTLTLEDILVPGIWPGLTVAPTVGETLTPVRDELASTTKPGREARLRGQLEAVKADYDLVLIDSGPALDTLTLNALTAADGVILITQSSSWSLDGLALLLRTIRDVRQFYNPSLEVAGLILNQHEPRTASGKYWAGELATAAGENGLRLIEPYVPKRNAIKDAIDYGQGLDEGDYKARPLGKLYDEIFKQLMERNAR